jgi:V8-like Glu-specific endopeptidase
MPLPHYRANGGFCHAGDAGCVTGTNDTSQLGSYGRAIGIGSADPHDDKEPSMNATAITAAASRPLRLGAAVTAIIVLATGVSTLSAHAATHAPAARPAAAAHTGHSVTDSAPQIVRFWTRQRLAKARPFPLGQGVASTPLGRHGERHAVSPSLRARRIAPRMPLARTGTPSPWWNTQWGRWPTVGRLYSYDPAKGWLGWCSGTVVSSRNGSTIWTAGHCLASGGYWHTKLLFIPGQNGPGEGPYGNPPYGSWAIRYIDTSATWLANNDCQKRRVSCPWGADYGAAVASTINGTTLQRWVGATPMWFGANLDGRSVRALGYPSVYPYFQQYAGYLFYCESAPNTYFQDVAGFAFWQKPCGMNGGASGGPWLTLYSSTWHLVSNNSSVDAEDAYGRDQVPTYMNGPYLDGSYAKSFFDAVEVK